MSNVVQLVVIASRICLATLSVRRRMAASCSIDIKRRYAAPEDVSPIAMVMCSAPPLRRRRRFEYQRRSGVHRRLRTRFGDSVCDSHKMKAPPNSALLTDTYARSYARTRVVADVRAHYGAKPIPAPEANLV